MKRIMMTAVMLGLGGGVYAAEFGDLASVKAAGLKDMVAEEGLVVPAAPVKAKSGFHIAASLLGDYRLVENVSGSCYEQVEVVPEDFLNAPLGNNLGLYGLPRGQGLIIGQVLEINAGLRFDREENPMQILPLPFQSSLIGYRPRLAEFDGSRLVYKTGEVRNIKPPVIKKGEILEVVRDGSELKISEGVFEGENISFGDVCRYTRKAVGLPVSAKSGAALSVPALSVPAPQAGSSDKLFAKKAVCRDAFVTMMDQPAEQAVPELKRMFEGINTADQKACRMEITYNETPQKRGSIDIYVLDSRLDPFNHRVPAANDDASCSAANTSVSAKYSWRQDSGWHYKYSTELSITKLQDGKLEVTYRQNKGEKLTCVGTIR